MDDDLLRPLSLIDEDRPSNEGLGDREVPRAAEVATNPKFGKVGGKLRITSWDLTPVGDDVRRMTRLSSNIHDFYQIHHNRTLGTGNFAQVKLATMPREDGSGDQEVAVKIISKSLVQRKDRIIQEIRMMRDMEGVKHVVHLYDVFESDDHLYLVLELAQGGELFDRLVKLTRYTEPNAKILFRQLVVALGSLHERGIMHRDIKPENILLVSKESDTDIVLGDFGLSKYFDRRKARNEHRVSDSRRRRNRAYTCCGTDIYMAPEVIAGDGGGYSYQADLWSAGVILYCLLAGYPPFYHDSDAVIKQLIRTAKYVFYQEEWGKVSQEAKDVIRALLVVNPKERATARQVLAMPWFDEVREPGDVGDGNEDDKGEEEEEDEGEGEEGEGEGEREGEGSDAE